MSDVLAVEELTPDLVAQYLRENPTFFLRREDLLAEMKLPHSQSGTVSLVEKQVSVLRDRNMDMRHRLSDLLENGRDNGEIFAATRTLILAMLETHSLEELVQLTEKRLVEDFDIDYCSLILLSSNYQGVRQFRVEDPADAQLHIKGLLANRQSVSGVLRPEEFSYLFPSKKQAASAVVVPIALPNNALALLSIASKDAKRYGANIGTLFIDYIGEVLQRLLGKHLA